MDDGPAKAFRSLPLSPEQDSEIRHFIHVKQRAGLPWDTQELDAILADMLDPPETDEEDRQALCAIMESERAVAAHEEPESRDPEP